MKKFTKIKIVLLMVVLLFSFGARIDYVKAMGDDQGPYYSPSPNLDNNGYDHAKAVLGEYEDWKKEAIAKNPKLAEKDDAFLRDMYQQEKNKLNKAADQQISSGGKSVLTEIQELVLEALAWILYQVATGIALLVYWVIFLIAKVAGFNDFTNIEVVKTGWGLVRDVCNMFFIIIMLMIAFGTILRQEQYSARLLPKVIIMAVLINFSKTIFGIIIDAAQVFTMTFVSAIGGTESSTNGPNKLAELLGIERLYKFSNENKDKMDPNTLSTVVLGLLLAIIFSLVALVVLAAVLLILIGRIFFLWIYVIFSPFAFLGFAFPPIKKYTQTIWEEFVRFAIIGPVMVFFIWLALYTAGNTSEKMVGQMEKTVAAGSEASEQIRKSMPEFFQDDIFINYLVCLGLLVGGMIMAQKIGGAAGSLAGKAIGRVKGGVNVVKKQAKKGAKLTGRWAGRRSLQAGGKVLSLGAKEGSTRAGIAKFASGWGNELQKGRDKEKADKRRDFLTKKLGLGDDQMKQLNAAADSKAGRVVKGMAGLAAGAALVATGNPFLGIGTIMASVKHLNTVGNKAQADADKKNRDTLKEEKTNKIKEAEKERDQKIEDEEFTWRHQPKDIRDKKVEEAKSLADAELAKKKQEIEDEYKDRLEETALEKKYKDYHPNKVTMDATDKYLKDDKTAGEKVDRLSSGADIMDFDRSAIYSASGQTAAQNKFFEKMLDGSERSTKAIDAMTKQLGALAKSGNISKSENKMIETLKQGFAAHLKGGGDKEGRAQPVIKILNEIKTGDGSHPYHNKSVEDFHDIVTPAKS